MSKTWAQPLDKNSLPVTRPGNPDTHFAKVVLSPTKCFDVIARPAKSSTIAAVVTLISRLFVDRAHLYNAAGAAVRCGLGPILALAKWGGGQIDAVGAYTDDTTDLQDAGANDFPVSTLVNDTGFIVGAIEKWSVAKFVVGTARVVGGGGDTYEYTYWNGAAWTDLAASLIDTPSWAAVATTYMTFFVPDDWALGGSGTSVPQTRYNIRVRATAAPGTTAAVVTSAALARIEDLRNVATVVGVDFLTLGSEPVIGGVGEDITAYWETANAASFVSCGGRDIP